jgi:hypothetical protein
MCVCAPACVCYAQKICCGYASAPIRSSMFTLTKMAIHSFKTNNQIIRGIFDYRGWIVDWLAATPYKIVTSHHLYEKT